MVKEAVQSVEQDGIVFIDEIDKIVSSSENRFGAGMELVPNALGLMPSISPARLISSLISFQASACACNTYKQGSAHCSVIIE